MKKIYLVTIILIAGCSAGSTYTGDVDPRLARLEAKQQVIAEREKRCIEETANVAATTDSVEPWFPIESDERDREVAECHATADQENAEISAQERKEYDLEAQDERNRVSLMMTLTASRQH